MKTLTVESFGYAVMKGTRHQPQDFLGVTARGVVGDRRFCLVDDAAQTVLRTVGFPQLMAVTCSNRGGYLEFDVPGAGVMGGQMMEVASLACDFWGRDVVLKLLDHPVNEVLSRYLGKRVRLAQARTGDLLFGDPLSIIGTATLEDLARRMNYPGLEAARFRSTFLVQTDIPYIEDSWVGESFELEQGGETTQNIEGIAVTIGQPIGRCAVIDANPSSGVLDFKVLRELAGFRPRNQRGEPTLGVYASLASARNSQG